MKKFDKRKELNFVERLIERWRLICEIVDLELEIKTLSEETKGDLLEYKRSGVPVKIINLEYKQKELEKLMGNEKISKLSTKRNVK